MDHGKETEGLGGRQELHGGGLGGERGAQKRVTAAQRGDQLLDWMAGGIQEALGPLVL